jgi:hypothetical protein
VSQHSSKDAIRLQQGSENHLPCLASYLFLIEEEVAAGSSYLSLLLLVARRLAKLRIGGGTVDDVIYR